MCMKVIWLIMPLLRWLCEKGERSNLNSIKWFFSLVLYTIFHLTWCIMVSHLSRSPELTLFISLVAEKINCYTSSFHRDFFSLPAMWIYFYDTFGELRDFKLVSAISQNISSRNRKKSSSFVIRINFKNIFFTEASLEQIKQKSFFFSPLLHLSA